MISLVICLVIPRTANINHNDNSKWHYATKTSQKGFPGFAWPYANPGNPLRTCIRKADSHPKHNSLVSTIPWLPFLTPTQHHFSLIYLLLASTWGLCPPQSVSLLRHAPPHPPSFGLAQAIFESNLFPYKYPNNLIPVILPAHTAYDDGTDSVPKSQHIKFRCWGITKK